MVLGNYEELIRESVTLDGKPLDAETYDKFLDHGHWVAVENLLCILDVIAPQSVVEWVKEFVFLRDRFLLFYDI